MDDGVARFAKENDGSSLCPAYFTIVVVVVAVGVLLQRFSARPAQNHPSSSSLVFVAFLALFFIRLCTQIFIGGHFHHHHPFIIGAQSRHHRVVLIVSSSSSAMMTTMMRRLEEREEALFWLTTIIRSRQKREEESSIIGIIIIDIGPLSVKVVLLRDIPLHIINRRQCRSQNH